MTPASNGQGEGAEASNEAIDIARHAVRAVLEHEEAAWLPVAKLFDQHAHAVAKKAVEAERERSNRLERQLGFANIYIRHLHSDALTQLARAESAEATAALLRAKEPESAESVPPERSV